MKSTCLFRLCSGSSIIIGTLLSLPLVTADQVQQQQKHAQCKVLPSDSDWPNKHKWDVLNATVHGRLVATTPVGHVCHDPNYSDTACEHLRENWGIASLQTSEPAEILSPWFQNETCVPFTTRQTPCQLGNQASYSVNVRSAADAAVVLSFAKKNNVRLVVRSTGHDLLGRSYGHGSLSLETHSLQDIDILSNYRSPVYRGPAVKVGAGVQVDAAARVAAQHGYRLVVGTCPTVCLAGGYTQGGGHSLLSGLYGLGADNVLEWEVLTAAGDVVTASPRQNADIYWALSGGGGGTYGVVISMTARLFEDGLIGGASLILDRNSAAGTASKSDDADDDTFWRAVEIFHSHLPRLVDDGGNVLAYTLSSDALILATLTAPNRTAGEVSTQLLSPLTSDIVSKTGFSLSSLGATSTNYSGYYEYYSSTLEPIIAQSPMNPVLGGRLIPRRAIESNVSAVVDAFRQIVADNEFSLTCVALNTNPSHLTTRPVAANSAHPAWRSSIITCLIGSVWTWGQSSWDLVAGQQDKLINEVLPILEKNVPGRDVYANEANFAQPGWPESFFGGNYNRLAQIKQKWDPDHVFYAPTGVGSDKWVVGGDKRLCRV